MRPETKKIARKKGNIRALLRRAREGYFAGINSTARTERFRDSKCEEIMRDKTSYCRLLPVGYCCFSSHLERATSCDVA